MKIKNHKKVLSRKYYMRGLWKITVTVYHTWARSIFADHENRLIKTYERRSAVGEPWQFVGNTVQTYFNA